jgi:ABC-type bacteriocin/lantibiotic exporter with double-glycine peptidase domain
VFSLVFSLFSVCVLFVFSLVFSLCSVCVLFVFSLCSFVFLCTLRAHNSRSICNDTLSPQFGNLMIDVKTSNLKLKDRALRMVMAASGADETKAAAALAATGDDSVKVALVCLRLGVDVKEARQRLDDNDGVVRRVLDAGK